MTQYEQKGWLSRSAYITSPINIELQNKDSIRKSEKIFFEYSAPDSSVTIHNVKFPLNKWVNSEFGVIRFTPNNLYHPSDEPGKLYFTLTSVNATAKGLSNSLKITSANKQSTVVSLSLKDPVPQRGERILNEVIQNYMNASVAAKNGQAKKTLDFVNSRLQAVSGELNNIESGIQKFRDDKGVVDMSTQSKQYLDNVQKYDNEKEQITNQLNALDNAQKYAEASDNQGSIIVPSTLGISDPTLSGLLEKLSNAEVKYENLKKTVGINNPMMTSVKSEMDLLRPKVLANINSQRQTLEQNRNNTNSAITKLSGMLSTVPEKETQLVQVSRQQNTKNSTYQYLLQKKDEATFSLELRCVRQSHCR